MDELTADHRSGTHLVRAMKLPIAIVLAVTSLPAGVMIPMLGIAVYALVSSPTPQSIHARLASHATVAESQRTAAWHLLGHALLILAPTLAAHLFLTTVARRRRHGFFLGFRGAGWLVLLWSTFLVGLIPATLLAVAHPDELLVDRQVGPTSRAVAGHR